MSMDPERLAEVRRMHEAGKFDWWCDEHVRDLLADRDDLAREAEDLREQVGNARHGMMVARAERDDAQHEALRWAARDHIGQRFPGEAVVKREAARAARFRGWHHLKFEADAPEGEQPCPGCRGVGGSEECGDCEVCKGRGKVGEQP